MNATEAIGLATAATSLLVAVGTFALAWSTRNMSKATRDMADGTNLTLEQGKQQVAESQRLVLESQRHADATESLVETATMQARRAIMPHLVIANYDKIEGAVASGELVFHLNNIGPGAAFQLGGTLFLEFGVGGESMFIKLHDIRYESEHSAAILPQRSEQLRLRVPPQLRNYISGGRWNGFQLDLNVFDAFGFRYPTRVRVMARQVYNSIHEDEPDDWHRPHGCSDANSVLVINGEVAQVGEDAAEWWNSLPA